MKKYTAVVLGIFFFLVSAFSLNIVVSAQQKTLTLSNNAKTAINSLAQDMLKNGPSSRIVSLKPQLDPQDYTTVKTIGILPDTPWYFLKSIGRGIRLFFTFDQAGKTYQLLKDGNEKTLEALLVMEKAANEKDPTKRDRLVTIAATTLNSVGSDFDSVAKTVEGIKKTDSIQAYLLQEEAFQFAGYYLKHQILLQKQMDRLPERDFLILESARVKHLGSVARIIVGESRDPVIFGQQLAQLLSSEMGSNNILLAAIAVLRDLENNANSSETPRLQNAQSVLQKELEIKLLKLSKTDRLKQIERFIAFVHGNPIRAFQAYNFLSKSFTSQEMAVLTNALKDAAAQDFKKHLDALDNADIQKQFVGAIFSNYPIDMRLLFYTEIQLASKTRKDEQKAKEAKAQLERLKQVKSILTQQVCQTYGKDAKQLINTRFYKEATTAPTVLDIRIGMFLASSLQNCNGKTAQAVAIISNMQKNIQARFASEAKTKTFTKLPTKAQAEEILREENITVASQDEQKVAEKIEEETQQIEEESSNPTALEKEIQQIIETVTPPVKETVAGELTEEIISEDSQTIVEEIIDETEPSQGEITQKKEQIIEEIEDAAANGETSELVEELPQEVQEEIAEEAHVPLPTATPTPTTTLTIGEPTSTPVVTHTATSTPTPTTILEPVVSTVQETTQSNASEPTPAPIPTDTEVVPGL